MDNCKNCVLRGNIEACMNEKCSIHDCWFTTRLLKENAKLKETLNNIVKLLDEIMED